MTEQNQSQADELDHLRNQNAKMIQLLKEIMESGTWNTNALELSGRGPSGIEIEKRIDEILLDAGCSYVKYYG